MKIVKHTSLEKSDDIKDTLEWKMTALKEDKLPIDAGLADYFALATDNIESELKYLRQVKQKIVNREKALKAQNDRIKVDGAIFLLENGLERLEGAICSSVTVNSGREESTTTEEVEKVIYNITPAEVDELLVGLGKAVIETETIEKTSKAIPPKLRINKRKVLVPEIEEIV